jgi:SET domain-containing protein
MCSSFSRGLVSKFGCVLVFAFVRKEPNLGGSLHLFVVSVADIKKGEEILIDYGSEYWSVLQDWHDSNDDTEAAPADLAKKSLEEQEKAK